MDRRFTIQFTSKQQGQLLREAIQVYGISKRALTAIKFGGGEITVNNQVQNVRYPLSINDVVQIRFPLEPVSDGLIAETDRDLSIVYEDDALIVINKPAYMSTIPSREHPNGSVANYLRGYYEQNQIHSTIHVVTRLDRDTSGLMCVAKHRHIHHLMSEMQKRGEIHRQYEAFVHGHIDKDFQSIIEPIGRKETSIIEREVRKDGQYAHTDMTVLRRFEVNGEKMTHIGLKLYTGRTHQIRVHSAFIGHPLVGDELYGGTQTHIARQALHCVSLSFIHPITLEAMQFTCELTQDIHNLMK